MDSDRQTAATVHGQVDRGGFESLSVLRVATDRQKRSKNMSEWESETHATTTVARNENGTIRYVKCRAEYFEHKKEEVEHTSEDGETITDVEEHFEEGVNAKFKFDVVDGSIAYLTGVKDIEDDPATGYDNCLEFVRVVPVAEQAVSNVPGIEEVHSTKEHILSELDRGSTAIN
jgi:hypothetical protein